MSGPNGRPLKPGVAERAARVAELHFQGLNLPQIATAIGCTFNEAQNDLVSLKRAWRLAKHEGVMERIAEGIAFTMELRGTCMRNGMHALALKCQDMLFEVDGAYLPPARTIFPTLPWDEIAGIPPPRDIEAEIHSMEGLALPSPNGHPSEGDE